MKDVISEPCYKAINLQRNYRKIANLNHFMVKKNWEHNMIV